LEDILQSAQEPWHERWYKRAWFANQDAKFLQDIRQRIIEAIKDFKVNIRQRAKSFSLNNML